MSVDEGNRSQQVKGKLGSQFSKKVLVTYAQDNLKIDCIELFSFCTEVVCIDN